MNVQLLNPFINAFNQATSVIFGKTVERQNIEIIDSVKEGTDVHIFLGLAGDLYGTVFLSTSKKNALDIVSTMEGRKFDDFDEISISALQEILNITSGGAITEFSEMGIDTDITPPTFVEGKDINIRLFYPILSVQLFIDSFSVYLNLAVKKRKSQKVMIIESNTIMKERLVNTLKLNKFQIVGEDVTGKNCLNVIEETRPGIVIYDISCLDQNDYYNLRQIKEKFPKIKIIATTLLGQSIKENTFPRVDDFISKPFEDDILLTMLRSV